MQNLDRPGSAIAILTVGFCLWHMFAIFLYLLPTSEEGIFHELRTISVPYVLTLSQWQKWDIFSPNPMRRMNVYRVERNAGDRWETAMILDFAHLPWNVRAKELKVLSRLQNGWKPLLPNYVSSLCEKIPGGPGSDIRLLMETTVLPSDLDSLKQTAKTLELPKETLLASVHCPRF